MMSHQTYPKCLLHLPDQRTVRCTRRQCCRRGSLLIEMIVCTMLLSVVATILVPGVFAVHQQRMHARVETLTLIELNNVASRLRHADDNTAALSPWFVARYPNSILKITPIAADSQAAQNINQPQALQLQISRPTSEGLPPWHRELVIWKSATAAESDASATEGASAEAGAAAADQQEKVQ